MEDSEDFANRTWTIGLSRPCLEAGLETIIAASPRRQAEARGHPMSTTGQVLVIDDCPDQLFIREKILQKAGIECLVAPNGKQALEMLREDSARTIRVVITDHVMPGMNGLEFVRKLRAIDRELPVIVCSGFPDAGEEYDGLNVAFLMKPCEPEEMIDLVKQVLGTRKHRATA